MSGPACDEPGDELEVRPFNARSLVLSVLLGLPEPRLPASAIQRLTGPFGIAAGTLRTALSRMVAAGELANDGGDYELRGRLLERKAAQDIGRRPPGDAWDGTWWIAAVTAPSRTVARSRFTSSTVASHSLPRPSKIRTSSPGRSRRTRARCAASSSGRATVDREAAASGA